MSYDQWVCFGCGRKNNVCYNTCWKCGTTQAESDEIEEKHRAENKDPRPVPPPIDPNAPVRVFGDFAKLAREQNALTTHVIFENTPGEHQAPRTVGPNDNAQSVDGVWHGSPSSGHVSKPYKPLSTWDLLSAFGAGVSYALSLLGLALIIGTTCYLISKGLDR